MQTLLCFLASTLNASSSLCWSSGSGTLNMVSRLTRPILLDLIEMSCLVMSYIVGNCFSSCMYGMHDLSQLSTENWNPASCPVAGLYVLLRPPPPHTSGDA